MERGDVVRVDLPPPKGPTGREQIGPRPAIVLQVEEATNLETIIVVPCTGQLHNIRHYGAVRISASDSNGLDVDSVALVHQLRTIDRRRIMRTLGRLSNDDLKQVEAGVRAILGF